MPFEVGFLIKWHLTEVAGERFEPRVSVGVNAKFGGRQKILMALRTRIHAPFYLGQQIVLYRKLVYYTLFVFAGFFICPH